MARGKGVGGDGGRARSERLVGWYERTGFRAPLSPAHACAEAGGQRRRSREAVAVGFFPVERLPLCPLPLYREIIRDAGWRGASHPGPASSTLGLGTVVTLQGRSIWAR